MTIPIVISSNIIQPNLTLLDPTLRFAMGISDRPKPKHIPKPKAKRIPKPKFGRNRNRNRKFPITNGH